MENPNHNSVWHFASFREAMVPFSAANYYEIISRKFRERSVAKRIDKKL
jgi:hypothetical protein